MAVPVDPIAVALSVGETLEALGIRYTIGGSLASSVAGEPRSTVDIDFVVALDSAQIPRLVAALGTDFYADTDALQRAVRNRSSARLCFEPSWFRSAIVRARLDCIADG